MPKTTVSARHLVTGLAGSRQYSVQAESAEDSIVVTVSSSDGFAASSQGTLFFDIAPDGKATPVQESAMPAAQDVAAAISKGLLKY